MDFLKQRRPFGFILEEVLGFGDKEKESGKPFVLLFQEMAAELGFTTRCMKIDAGLWGQVSRPRLYVFGISSELGGTRAADWLAEAVDGVLQYQSLQQPFHLFPREPGQPSILSLDASALRERTAAQAPALAARK